MGAPERRSVTLEDSEDGVLATPALAMYAVRIPDSSIRGLWRVNMPSNFYYVYSLKDPRSSPARPFYVGKGTGSRAYDHLVLPDGTRKYARIREILESGAKPMVVILVDDLTEAQALKLEAELIAALGTEATRGLLTNAVVPTGLGGKERGNLVVPQGVVERAQIGLELIKSAIVEFAEANPDGVTNADAASLLGLRSDYRGRQKDYLSYSVFGLLIREGRVRRDGRKHRIVGGDAGTGV